VVAKTNTIVCDHLVSREDEGLGKGVPLAVWHVHQVKHAHVLDLDRALVGVIWMAMVNGWFQFKYLVVCIMRRSVQVVALPFEALEDIKEFFER